MFTKTKQFITKFKKSLNNLDNYSGSLSLPLNEYQSRLSPLNAYELSLYTNKAISKRAEKIGQVEFQISKNGEVVEDDPILQVLRKPNKPYSGYQFWSLWSKYMDIYGSCFIEMDKDGDLVGGSKLNALHILNPESVKIKFDEKTGEITSAKQKTAKGEVPIEVDDLIYFFRPDPANPLRGASLIKSGIRSIETEMQIQEYHAKVLQNGGRVEGIFNFKGGLNKEQLAELRDAYQKHYGDAKKSGEPMFLGGDVDYKRVALLPDEMSYLETKKTNLQDISILTGVPKTMLGAFDEIKYDNAEASNRIFINEAIKPVLDNLVNVLNEKLLPEDRELTYIDFAPEDQELKLKTIENGIKNYYITPNEAREMQGFEPIDGGDELLIPMNLLPNTSEPVQEVKTKKESKHPLSSYEARRKYEQLVIKRLDRRERKFKRVLMRFFREQEDRIVSSIQGEKAFKKKDLIAEVFNQSLEVKLAKESVLGILEELVIEAGQDAKLMAGSDFEFLVNADVGNFLDKKSDIFAKQINETTFKKLKGEFSESFANGESRKELVDRIRETYSDISEGRANTIATTETHTIVEYGKFEAYKQANLPVKVWVTVGDGKVRPSHASIDGEERRINEPFSNGLQYPSDPAGSAEDTINCRCAI